MSNDTKVYGIWHYNAEHPNGGGWMKDANGQLFQSPSRGVMAYVLKQLNNSFCRVAVFGDDGLPKDEQRAMSA